MTVTYGASADLTLLAGYLVLPGLGAILLVLGVWQLSRGLRGMGHTDTTYDIVLRGRRTSEGREVVIRGGGAVMTFLGVTLLTMGLAAAITSLTR